MSNSLQFDLLTAELSAELSGGSVVRRTLLANGVRVLTERVPGARSATVGFWVPVGSRDEQSERPDAPASEGSTHFLEHLLFKGTPRLNALQIAESFDRVGAEHNALTAKEYTCYYAKVRDLDLEMAVGLLTEMVTTSVIDPGEFETERGVILEELAMAHDDLADVASEAFFETVLPEHPLGRPIGGTPEVIRAARRDDVWQHYQQRYAPSSLVISVAGAVDHDALLQWISQALTSAAKSAVPGAERWSPDTNAAPLARRELADAAVGSGDGLRVVHREGGQVNLMIGSAGLRSYDDRRYAFSLMNAALGSGMSSRLFQVIREQHGLAYTTYSFGGGYSDAGVFGMYAGCAPENAKLVVELAREQLSAIAAEGLAEQERSRVLGQLAGSATLGLEDSESRMGRLARAELGNGEFVDLDEMIARHQAVTNDEVRAIAGELSARAHSVIAVGDITEQELR